MTHTENYQLSRWSRDDRLLMADFNADNSKLDAALKAAADAVSTKAEAADLAALTNTVNTKANAADLAALTTTVNAKASAADLTSLTATVNKKADASTVTSLTATVNKKADASTVTSLTATVNKKADASTVTALSNTVSTKADISALNALAATVPKVVVGSYTGDGATSRVISLGFTPKAIFINTQYGQTHLEGRTGYYYGGLALQGKPVGYNGRNAIEIVTNGVTVGTLSDSSAEARLLTNMDGYVYYYVAFA